MSLGYSAFAVAILHEYDYIQTSEGSTIQFNGTARRNTPRVRLYPNRIRISRNDCGRHRRRNTPRVRLYPNKTEIGEVDDDLEVAILHEYDYIQTMTIIWVGHLYFL